MPCHTSAYPSLCLCPCLCLSLSLLSLRRLWSSGGQPKQEWVFTTQERETPHPTTNQHGPSAGGWGGYIIFTPARSDPGFLPVRARGRASGRASADHKNDHDLTRRPSRKKKSRKKRGVEMGKADSLFLK